MLHHLLAAAIIITAAGSATSASAKAGKRAAKPATHVSVPLMAAPSAPHYVAADLSLPALGTDRRVVLSGMRRVGLHMLDGAGARLVFDGGPLGWRDVSRSVFDFDGMTLDLINLEFATQRDDLANRDLFLALRKALAERNGLPWFDRVREGDPAVEKGVEALAMQQHSTSWAKDGTKITLSATYGQHRAVRVVVQRDAHTEAAAELATAGEDDRPWGAQQLTGLAVVSRLAADSLFDDFGEQPAVTQGAKLKGSPISVRLASVHIPKDVAGIDQGNITKRFERFVNGNWDVDAGSRGHADVELEVDVVPMSRSTPGVYAMRLSARVAKGNQKGETLYAAVQALR